MMKMMVVMVVMVMKAGHCGGDRSIGASTQPGQSCPHFEARRHIFPKTHTQTVVTKAGRCHDGGRTFVVVTVCCSKGGWLVAEF